MILLKHSWKTGLSFGLTSGVITTLGLIIGLGAGTHLKAVVIGGIITIAVADSMSDALGIHMAEESKEHNSTKEGWESTISTFITKLVIALSFIFPVFFLSLTAGLITSIAWGLLLISVISFFLARSKGDRPLSIISEHLIITIAVIVLSHLIGTFVNNYFS